jgi:hypothetical protein
MVIKNVCFSGQLKQNCLRVKVDEDYCTLRAGHWRFRLESLAVTILPPPPLPAVQPPPLNVHFTIGCSLLTSPQELNGEIVSAATPLHVLNIFRTSHTPAHVTVLAPGLHTWHEFNDGSQIFEIRLRVIPSLAEDPKQLNLFICGILEFEAFEVDQRPRA